ncbi:hypothetical protein ES702_02811 [subsurface metagenome]
MGIKKLTNTALTAWISSTVKNEVELLAWIDSLEGISRSNIVKEILFKVKSGELRTTTTDDLKKKKMLVDIKFKEVCTQIKEKELLHWNTFDKTPSSRAKTAIKNGIEINSELQKLDSPSVYDEKNHKFVCPDCQENFIFSESESDIAEAKQNFCDHFWQNHGAIPKKIEHELRELV